MLSTSLVEHICERINATWIIMWLTGHFYKKYKQQLRPIYIFFLKLKTGLPLLVKRLGIYECWLGTPRKVHQWNSSLDLRCRNLPSMNLQFAKVPRELGKPRGLIHFLCLIISFEIKIVSSRINKKL